MAYALVLTLDPDFTEHLRNVWNRFAQSRTGRTPAQRSEPPHVTLAISDDAAPDRFWDAAAMATPSNAALTLLPFGVFLAERCVVYFNAVLSEELQRAHREIYGRLTRDNVPFDPLYATESVVFHCTVAVEVERAQFSKSVELLSDLDLHYSGRAAALELWEFFPVQALRRRPL